MQVRLESLTWAPYLICLQRTLLGHSLHSQQPPCPQHRRFHVGSRRVTAVESRKSRGAPSPARTQDPLRRVRDPTPILASSPGLRRGARSGGYDQEASEPGVVGLCCAVSPIHPRLALSGVGGPDLHRFQEGPQRPWDPSEAGKVVRLFLPAVGGGSAGGRRVGPPVSYCEGCVGAEGLGAPQLLWERLRVPARNPHQADAGPSTQRLAPATQGVPTAGALNARVF
ncbi:uncharacterized protein [Macaca fascicularis]|uniref:uncharacterized protein n=1 Tax=Macaca fascicularis TaxID=9541 RepID=UPI0032B07A59